MKFRDYQIEIMNVGAEKVNRYGFVYLAMEVRIGKTLTALGMCEKLNAENVLFVTKKKAMSSIANDIDMLCPSYVIFIINYESLHKIPDVKWDVVILDEAHSLGRYPKPSNRAKNVAKLIKKNNSKVILMSGTPTPESYSQMYHQVYGIATNPFRQYKNFYRFADSYVNKKSMKINGYNITNYDDGMPQILEKMKPYMISYTQKQAGFSSKITEHVHGISLDDNIRSLIKKLKKDRILRLDENLEMTEDLNAPHIILADTGVKMMSKVHQLCSGTVKSEDGQSLVINTYKAEYIKKRFGAKKTAIFYKFKAEWLALKEVFGDDLTDDIDEFNKTNKHIALQIVSGREGTKLSEAENLVYYNIDFSATSYWQSRDRMTTKDRLKNNVYWIFSLGGIEYKIYETVSGKKNYTLSHFRNDFKY